MSLTDEQVRQLERLRNRATSYEVVVVRSDGARRLVAYTARHSQSGLRAALYANGPATLKFLGLPATAVVTEERGRLEVRIDGNIVVKFSGRTKRDCIMNGEIEWVGTAFHSQKQKEVA